MATQSLDARLRDAPPVNKVQGYNAIARPSDFVKGKTAAGFFKVAVGNRNDFIETHGRVVGPWTDADEAELRHIVSTEGKPATYPGPITGTYAAANPTAAPLVDTPKNPDGSDADKPVAPKMGAMDGPTAKMIALKAELIAGGVRIDDKWGMNRLTNEVELLHKRQEDEEALKGAPKAAGGAPSGVSAPAAK